LRKRLLLAESELNRAELSEEWQTITFGVRDLAHRAKVIAACASSAALLVAAFRASRPGPPPAPRAKSSWFQKILKGASLASAIWSALPRKRSRWLPKTPRASLGEEGR
jgi:hypothetical protein